MDGNAENNPDPQDAISKDFIQAGGDSAAPLNLRDTVRQTIELVGNDQSGSVPVYGREVSVIPSEASKRDSRAPGSSKVKITPVVKYDWEHKYYVGNLVAVNQIYLVYVLKIQSGYGLRILDRRTSVRALLKGFEDIITDVAFAHHQSNVLGCIDRLGNMTVWQILDVDGKIAPNSKLKVMRPPGTHPTDYHRLVWCPYLPDDPTASDSSSISDENSRLLAVTHEERAEFWDLDVVIELFGNVVNADSVTDGVIRICSGHTKPITDLSVAPDGQVLATASEDGTVKFWQMDMAAPDQAPARLHRFSPHDGRPLSSLIFCDNHKYQDPDLPFWRFLITGACANRELMMWCTVTWTCLQKISFTRPGLLPEPFLKIKLDLSASFLIATDITRKVLYVLQVHQDHSEGHAHMSSITEFLLTQPTLSFAIVDAGKCRLKPLLEEGEEGEELNSGEMLEMLQGDMEPSHFPNSGVLVKMFCINSTSVQDLQVRFQPNSSVEHGNMAGSVSSASQDDYALQDGLSDMSMNDTDRSAGTDVDRVSAVRQASSLTPGGSLTSSFTSESTNPSTSPGQPYLMTPEAIKSSSAKTLAEHLRESNSSASSFTQVSALNTSADDLLTGSHHSGENSTPTPRTLTPVSSLPATPKSPQRPDRSATPPQVDAALAREKDEDGSAEDDEGPKSPPPTPTELASPELIARSAASTDDLVELLENARMKEKRISDSSAEVAHILQGHLGQDGDQEAEVEDDQGREDEEDEKEDDDVESKAIPVTVDSIAFADAVKQLVDPVQVTQPPSSLIEMHGEDASGVTQGREVVVISPKQEKLGVTASEEAPGGEGIPTPTQGEEGETAETPQSGDESREQQVGGAMAPVPQQLLEVQEQESRSEHSSDVEPADSTSPPGSKSKAKKQRRDKYSRSSPRPRKSLPTEADARLDMPEINNTLQQVLNLLQSQQQELKQMKQDIAKSQPANSIIQSMRSRIDKLDKSLCTKLETSMAKQSEQERQRLNTAMQERQSLDKQKQERLLECVSQNLNKSVNSRLDKTVRTEIENKVVPEIGKLIAPMSEQLSTVVSQKLTATDQLMRENIGKLVRSKSTTEALGQSAANALSNTIQTTYREAFRTSVVPAFEQSCQSLFMQVNTAFEAGTRQYTQQLESHLNKQRQQERESRDPIVAELVSLAEEFKASSQTLKESILSSVNDEVEKQLQKANEKLEEDLLGKVRKLLKEELQNALRDHQSRVESSITAAVVRSQAPTPVPQGPDIRQVQSQITQLLQQGHIIQAFQSALSASDLRAVLFVCNAVNPDQLFGGQCPLDQPVLLSLIQQLSHDIGTNTKLKLRYIDEALLVLDEDKTTTQYSEHLPIVIGDLCKHITAFLQQHPSHPSTKQMKRVLALANSLM
ncbi:enhancer of mRNA-decapping protein 4-like isoform X2 [Acanthaster planci]|nr:enhancer of mRNA-decapping protein 4-like isoform X2 [Acanthaster planci]